MTAGGESTLPLLLFIIGVTLWAFFTGGDE